MFVFEINVEFIVDFLKEIYTFFYVFLLLVATGCVVVDDDRDFRFRDQRFVFAQ